VTYHIKDRQLALTVSVLLMDDLPAVVVVATTATAAAAVPLLFPGSAAIRAALGFIGKTLFLVECLFALCKNKLRSTIFAYDLFFWHVLMPP
jgi:hypothetical protein